MYFVHALFSVIIYHQRRSTPSRSWKLMALLAAEICYLFYESETTTYYLRLREIFSTS